MGGVGSSGGGSICCLIILPAFHKMRLFFIGFFCWIILLSLVETWCSFLARPRAPVWLFVVGLVFSEGPKGFSWGVLLGSLLFLVVVCVFFRGSSVYR